MNELTQERIAEQFVKLADESGLMGKVIAKRLGIPVLYITYIRNSRYFDSISKAAWQAFREYVIAGKILDGNVQIVDTSNMFPSPPPPDPERPSVKVQTVVNKTVESQRFGIDIDITITVNGKQVIL